MLNAELKGVLMHPFFVEIIRNCPMRGILPNITLNHCGTKIIK